jgi:hypothetical protein
MASTTFIDGSTVIVSSWLNDVNNLTYNGVFQSSDISITGTVTVPVYKSTTTLSLQTNGTTTGLFIDTSQNVVLGGNSSISGYKATSTGSLIANGSLTGYGADPNLSAGGSRAFLDFSGEARVGSASGGGSGGNLGFYVNGSRVGGFDTSGNLTANGQFNGAGTGLTGTAASLSIGGNAATATNATNATNATYSTTQSAGTNNTTIATTAFTTSAVNSLFSSVNNVTSSRALGTGYTNTTGKPMFVQVQVNNVNNTSTSTHMIVGGVALPGLPQYSGGTYLVSCSAIVPSGATYSCSAPSGTLGIWIEQY